MASFFSCKKYFLSNFYLHVKKGTDINKFYKIENSIISEVLQGFSLKMSF